MHRAEIENCANFRSIRHLYFLKTEFVCFLIIVTTNCCFAHHHAFLGVLLVDALSSSSPTTRVTALNIFPKWPNNFRRSIHSHRHTAGECVHLAVVFQFKTKKSMNFWWIEWSKRGKFNFILWSIMMQQTEDFILWFAR